MSTVTIAPDIMDIIRERVGKRFNVLTPLDRQLRDIAIEEGVRAMFLLQRRQNDQAIAEHKERNR